MKTVATNRFEGKAFVRIFEEGNGSSWEWYWVVNGILGWFWNEFDSSPIGIACIDGEVNDTECELETGEKVFSFEANTISGKSVFQIAICEREFLAWISIFRVHIGIAQDIDIAELWFKVESHSKEFLESQIVCSSSMNIDVNGELKSVTIFPSDDVEKKVKSLIEEIGMKPEMKATLEKELLQVKLEASQNLIANLTFQVNSLNRRSLEILIAEERASLAEEHCNELTISLGNTELLLPQIRIAIDDAKSRIVEKENQLSTLYQYLGAEQRNQKHLETMVFDSAAKLIEAERLVDLLNQEKLGMRKKLDAMKSSVSKMKDESVVVSGSDSVSMGTNNRINPEVKELRHQKAFLSKQLSISEELLKQTQQELTMLLGTKAAQRRGGNFSDVLNSPEEDIPPKFAFRLRKAEERLKSTKQMLAVSEETNANLRQEIDELLGKLATVEDGWRSAINDVESLRRGMKDSRCVALEKHLSESTHENERLKRQIIVLRGEILSLQGNIDEIKSSAALALQTLQVYNPIISMNNLGNVMPQATANIPENMDYFTSANEEVIHRESDHDEMQFNVMTPSILSRLYAAIYSRYVAESGVSMNLTRFVRFAKDFGIVAYSSDSSKGPYLVGGEVDIVFLNSSRTTTLTDEEVAMKNAPKRAFVVGKRGGIIPQSNQLTKSNTDAVPTLSPSQFVSALKMLAIKLYSNAVEEEFGEDIECMSDTQKEHAYSKSLEMLLTTKIFPVATKLELIPWPLIYVDHTIVHLSDYRTNFANQLELYYPDLATWFGNYATIDANSMSPVSPQRPSLLTKLGVSYKQISKFLHNFGIAPYLVKESDLFKLFQEVLIQSKENQSALFHSIPPQLRSCIWIAKEFGNSSVITDSNEPFGNKYFAVDKVFNSDKLGLGSFLIYFCALSFQAFPTIAGNEPLNRLMGWCADSGGAVFIDKPVALK